jgi:hypothetical protein
MDMLSASRCRCSRGLRRTFNHEEHDGTRSRILFQFFVSFVSFVVIAGERTACPPVCGRLVRHGMDSPWRTRWRWAGRLLPVHPKRQAELRAQRKGILFFLKRFGLFPFVRGEHNSTSTKNENKKHDNSMVKKVNRPREQKEYVSPEMFNAT